MQSDIPADLLEAAQQCCKEAAVAVETTTHGNLFARINVEPIARAILFERRRQSSEITALRSRITSLEAERDAARRVVRDTLWMAGRYADGRKTYAVSIYNDALAVAKAGGYDDKASEAIDGSFDDVPSRCDAARDEGVKAERERCALIVENISQIDVKFIAAAIRAEPVRRIAIIAHVDHGKTSLAATVARAAKIRSGE